MEYVGKSHPDTLIRLGRSEDFEAFAPALVSTQDLAGRIAAVLDERRRIGEQRRQRERECLRRQAERAQARECRGREPKGSNRFVGALDALCEAVTSHNAAYEAMKEYEILDVAESATDTENGGACGNACI